MAISLIFASTDIVRTLKIPKPANRMMSETVIATDMLNVRKSWSVLSSRSCQLRALCWKRDSNRLANPGASDGRNIESPVLAVGREQLHGVADACLKQLGQARTDNDRAGVISKIIKFAVNQLVENVSRLRVQSRIDAVQLDRSVLKSRASAYCSAKDR